MSTFDLFSYEPPAPLPEAPYVRNSETSKAAAEAVRPALAFLEEKVLDAIKAAGGKGMTCDECERATGLPHQTASARYRGLEQRGLIRRTDDKRPTRSGRNAVVYQASGASA